MKQSEPDNQTILSEREVEQLARSALDASIEHLDGATLSRLNRARQQAVEGGQRSIPRRIWISLAAAGLASLAIAVALPLTNPAGPAPGTMESPADDAYYGTADDLEVVEDLDLVLWMMENEDNAS